MSAALVAGMMIMSQCDRSHFDITTGAVLRGPVTARLLRIGGYVDRTTPRPPQDVVAIRVAEEPTVTIKEDPHRQLVLRADGAITHGDGKGVWAGEPEPFPREAP
jgi:hypothetical protein